jgi:hypothetical protein
MRLFKQVGSLMLAASVCLLLLGATSLMADHPDEVARNGFAQMREPVFNLDFCTAEEWAEASLGEGFPICTIRGQTLLDREKTDKMIPLRRLVEETADWYFPVISADKPVAMLFVSRLEGRWQVSGIGHGGIARELGDMLSTWKPSDGYAFRFVRSFEAKSDFLEIYGGQTLMRTGDTDPRGYLPFLSARVALELPEESALASSLLVESQFIDKLARRVEAGMVNPLEQPVKKPDLKER